MDWSRSYTPARLLMWVQLYGRLATNPAMPRAKADVKVLHSARDLLAKKGVLA